MDVVFAGAVWPARKSQLYFPTVGKYATLRVVGTVAAWLNEMLTRLKVRAKTESQEKNC